MNKIKKIHVSLIFNHETLLIFRGRLLEIFVDVLSKLSGYIEIFNFQPKNFAIEFDFLVIKFTISL